jgi:hypothetical protein
MWHWENNGPRPPWSNRQVIAALLAAWILKCFTQILQDGFVGIYQTIIELQRRHPGW